MDKLILKLLLNFIKLLAVTNIDFEKLKVIAETKVMMDRRRTPSTFRAKQRKEMKNPLLITLIMYAFLGIFMAVMVWTLDSIVISMVFLHGYFLFMMAMTLVTDFSSVLLDTTDNQIILPKPVNSRTFFLSRLVHILVYLLQFTIALSIFPITVTVIKFGVLVGLVLVITTLLTVAFSVFLTYLLYALLMRVANEQKIKDIVSYFQIFMTIFFAVGFQVLPRLIDFENVNFTFTLNWYAYLLPPVWMALTLDAFQHLSFSSIHIIMMICAIAVPIGTVWLMVKYLAPSFNRKLGALALSSGGPVGPGDKQKRHIELSSTFATVFCSSKTEFAGFTQVWKITSRDKNFKMQFYPSLAYLGVFAFIFVFKSGKDVQAIWLSLPDSKMFLWFIYLPMMSITSSLTLVSVNENFAAGWIYQASPLAKPGQLISGMLKALFTKFFMPIYILALVFSFEVWGVEIIDDFILGLVNNVLIFLVIANLSDHYLPFSRQPNVKEQTGKLIRMLLQFVVVAIPIGCHYLALNIYWLPAALIPVSAAAGYFLLKRIQHLSWLQIST